MLPPSAGELLQGWTGVAAGFLAAALVIGGWALVRLSRLVARVKARRREVRRLAAVLSQAEAGALLLGHPETVEDLSDCAGVCSRRLAVLLGLAGGEESTPEAVLAALDPEDAAALSRRMLDLVRSGEGFAIPLTAANGRRLRATGVRADEASATALTSVVWFSDVTDESRAAAAAAAEIADLGRARSRYRAALDALPLPVWLRDADLNLSFCNLSYARAVGAEGPKAARNHGIEILGGGDGREGRALAARALAAGGERHERLMLAVGGALRTFEAREAPLAARDAAEPALAGTVGVALDLTEQTDARAELSRHDEAHALVLERLGTAIAVFGADQRLSFYNTAFVRLWSLDAAWLDSEPDYATLLEVLRDRRELPEVSDFPAYKAAELALFTDLLEPIEALMHLPGGTTLRRVVAPHPLGGLLITYEDVTDTLVLERSYNTLIDVQAQTLNHLREAVAVFDGGGVLCLSNAAFARLWDLPEVHPQPGGAEASGTQLRFPEVVEMQARFLVGETGTAPFAARMAEVYHSRAARVGVLTHARMGQVAWNAAPLPDGGVVFAYDAGGGGGALGASLAGGLTRVIAAAQRSIAGWSDVLSHGHARSSDTRRHAYLDSISAAALAMERLLAVVDDAAAESPPSESPADLHAVLSEALARVRDRAARRAIELVFDCPPDIGQIPLAVEPFSRLVALVFDVALAGTAQGDRIALSARRIRRGRNAGVSVTVADTGAGWVDAAAAPEPGDGVRAAWARLRLIRAAADVLGWRFDLVTVPGQGTAVTLSR